MLNDVPTGRHYAVLIASPKDSEVVYRAFTDKTKWLEEIGRLVNDMLPFKALEVTPQKVKVEVKVSVE